MRRVPGLGGASWAAMMRLSCCTDSRPSSTTTTGPGIAAALWIGKQLQGVPLVLPGVVPGYSPAVLEAQDLFRGQVHLQGPECGLGTLGRNSKTPVEPGEELLQYGPGLLKGGCSREPQFRDQPVLEGSGRPLDSALGLGRQGEYHLNPQFLHCPSELGGRAGGLIFRLVLEDRVPVGVQGEGNTEAPEQALHQPEVAAGPSHPPRPYPGDERRGLPPPPQWYTFSPPLTDQCTRAESTDTYACLRADFQLGYPPMLGVACNLQAYYAGAAASSLAVVWKLQATVSMRGLFL